MGADAAELPRSRHLVIGLGFSIAVALVSACLSGCAQSDSARLAPSAARETHGRLAIGNNLAWMNEPSPVVPRNWH